MNSKNVAVIADTSGGISRAEAEEIGLILVPVPFHINDEPFFEELTISHEEFFKRIAGNVRMGTSQPNPEQIRIVWEEALQSYEQLVYIPMSAALSSSYENTSRMAKEFGGRVEVINTYRVCGPMRHAIEDAIFLRNHGKNAAQIRALLEENALNYSAYVLLDNLDALKRGGRVTPAVAAISSTIHMKPILTFSNDVLHVYAKAIGKKMAVRMILTAMKNDLETKFSEFAKNGEMRFIVGDTGCREEALAFMQLVKETFPGIPIQYDRTPLNIACHIGIGGFALYCSRCLSAQKQEGST